MHQGLWVEIYGQMKERVALIGIKRLKCNLFVFKYLSISWYIHVTSSMLLHIRHSSFDGRLLDGIADNVKYVVKARIELGQVASRQSTRVKT